MEAGTNSGEDPTVQGIDDVQEQFLVGVLDPNIGEQSGEII